MTTLTNHSAIPTLGESRTGKVARKTAAATQAKVWGDDQREMLANFLIGKKLDAMEARIGSDMTMSESLAIAALDVDRIAADAVSDGYTARSRCPARSPRASPWRSQPARSTPRPAWSTAPRRSTASQHPQPCSHPAGGDARTHPGSHSGPARTHP